MAAIRCFECGRPAKHNHHVVPESQGGTRTVPLCVLCHSKVHGRSLTHASMIKAGLAVAKANGKRLGRKPSADGKGPRIKVTTEQEAIVKRLKHEGQGVSAIARTTGLSRPTVYSIIGHAVPV